MKINLTDQELNEWVINNILKWKENVTGMNPGYWYDNGILISLDLPDPCNNLNHTHLMEEKIREMGKGSAWNLKLQHLIFLHTGKDIHNFGFNLTHASARQRVEAAYLTFKEKKNGN